MLDLAPQAADRLVTLGAGAGPSVRRGTVALRPTVDAVGLLAEFADGSCVQGGCRIAPRQRPIRRVSLTPGRARATPEALAALAAADVIALGPGKLYSGILPTLLVRDIARAVAASPAASVLVLNLMTEPGATDGYDATDFILTLRRHAPSLPLALTVLVNSTPLPDLAVARYARRGARPVAAAADTLANLGCRVVRAPLLADGVALRHDPTRLERALRAIARA